MSRGLLRLPFRWRGTFFIKLHSELSLDDGEHVAMHRLRVARSVDQHATSGVVCGDLPVPLTESFVEIGVEALEAVRARSSHRTGEPDLDR